jgi:uncharacterized protein YjbI with pentapeptide repeats
MWRANFKGSTINQANLKNATLEEANFPNTALSGANFTSANLTRLNLHQSKVDHANFQHAHMMFVNLTDSSATYANFEGADLKRSNFENTDLTQANFKNTDLYQANFKNAKLIDTNFEGSNLEAVSLHNADISGVSMKGINLKESNFKEAYLHPKSANDTNYTPFGCIPNTHSTTSNGTWQKAENTVINANQTWNPNKDKLELCTNFEDVSLKDAILYRVNFSNPEHFKMANFGTAHLCRAQSLYGSIFPEYVMNEIKKDKACSQKLLDKAIYDKAVEEFNKRTLASPQSSTSGHL